MSAQKATPNPKKALLRKDVDERLVAMTDEDRKRQSDDIVKKILNHPKYKSAKRISLFLSLPNEVDTDLILQDVLARGDTPFTPQYARGKMRMLRVMPGDLEKMVPTSWGIKQHAHDADREDGLDNGGLDLVIAPGAAFTTTGWRCGHGGGYYDRYLTTLLDKHRNSPDTFTKPYILAVGFKQQIYTEIPVDPQDVLVDEILTGD